MAILVNEDTNCLIQGITGRTGHFITRLLLDYGTNVSAGVTPGKGGEKVYGIPVYNTVEEALEHHPSINSSIAIVPAPFAKSATLEAMDAGISLILLYAERVPHQDVLELIEYNREKKATIIGPNSIGIISPGKALLGAIGARAELAKKWFTPGAVGVISRSGGQTTTVSYMLTHEGIGQSTAIGIGGDAFVGTGVWELLLKFEKDKETKAVALFGEIGTTQEERAAQLLEEGKFTKPLVAYVAGKYAMEGLRFGHAGAIIHQGKGTAQKKVEALRNAGAVVLDHLDQLPKAVRSVLKESKNRR